MWMGGPIPIGYALHDRKLVPDAEEAATVQLIFERYIELRSISALVDEFYDRGIVTKSRTYRDGKTVGGIPFSKGPLAALLQNPIYIGKVRHRDQIYDGQHEAIIDPELFAKVQAILDTNRQDRRLGRNAKNPSLLTLMLFDPDGRLMSPSHANKGSRRYRYYQTRLGPGEKDQVWRLPAGEIERLVITSVVDHLRGQHPDQHTHPSARELADALAARKDMADNLPQLPTTEQRRALMALQVRIDLQEAALVITIGEDKMTLASKLVRRGNDVRLVIAEHRTASPDPILCKLVAQGFAARDYLMTGSLHPCIREYSPRYLKGLARISWLAPDMISAILDGTQPAQLTGRRLIRANAIPLDWASQRKMFGFA